MGKYQKKKKNQTGSFLLALAMLAVLAALVCIVVFPGKQTQTPETTEPALQETETLPVATEEQPIELSDGLVIRHLGGYAGIYMEDGTDEVVSDVMMLILENTADKDLQLARIRIEYPDFTAEFEVTNIPAGEKVVALEKNRRPKTAEAFLSAESYNVVFFPEAMSLLEDRIQITGADGSLEVANISSQDIAGDIVIYYKNSAADLLYGGITYRVRIQGGLAAGETRQIIAGHYTAEGSRLMTVDCGD